MIEVKSIQKKFGKFEAVKNINFTIKQGEIVGLLGPNGAGKTTTMRLLTGYYKPTSGVVSINNLSYSEDLQQIQKMIGYLPETSSTYTDMLVCDYLKFIATARGVPANSLAKNIKKAVQATDLGFYYYRPISQLSKGYRQRVGLASTLVHDPEVLILDEPTSGLDPNQIKEMQHLIKNLAASKTIILSTHILSEVEATCERAIIINKGNIVLDKALIDLKKSVTSYIYTLKLKGYIENIDSFFKYGQVSVIERIAEHTKLEIHSTYDSAEDLFNLAVSNKLVILELFSQKNSLEDVFSTLTLGVNS